MTIHSIRDIILLTEFVFSLRSTYFWKPFRYGPRLQGAGGGSLPSQLPCESVMSASPSAGELKKGSIARAHERINSQGNIFDIQYPINSKSEQIR